MKTWDCVIVGAGPAGLSAAVYMGRFRRSTLVIDNGDGRWSYGQVNDNYLGFPRASEWRSATHRSRGWRPARRATASIIAAGTPRREP